MSINHFFKSKTIAWIIFILAIIWIVCDVAIGGPWWFYLPVFFAFMSSFCNLVSIYLAKLNHNVSKKLNSIENILALMAFISLIAVYLLN